MKVGTEVWRFRDQNGDPVDYPGQGGSDDSKLPISHISLKAWDEIYWMSTFDKHAAAVSGPAQLAKLVNVYKAQGIGFELWCVPKGSNVSAMLDLAKACLDVPGVEALTFDVEPYAGFAGPDAPALATTLMKVLHEQRPNARLGVRYDPRSQHWTTTGITEWLKYADIASPMVYWVSFAGQGVWADPVKAVQQAHSDLVNRLVPGRPITYAPLLQGNAPAGQVVAAVNASVALGGRPSLWRRGVVAIDTWLSVNGIALPEPPPAPVPLPVPAPAPPPVDPCADLKKELAELNDELAALHGQLIAKTNEAGQLTAEFEEARGSITSLQSQLDATHVRLGQYEALRSALALLKQEIATL